MKKSKSISIAAALFVALTSISCNRAPYSAKLTELDNLIASRNVYREKLETRAVRFRKQLNTADNDSVKWELSYRLSGEYLPYNIDSLLKYSNMLNGLMGVSQNQKFLSTIRRAEASLLIRDYGETANILASIDTSALNPSQKFTYFKFVYDYYTRRKDDLMLYDNKEVDRVRAVYARKEAIKYPGLDTLSQRRFLGYGLKDDGIYGEALNVFIRLYNDVSSERDKYVAAIGIAAIYKYLSDKPSRIYWLAQASIHEMKIPGRESVSLYYLAMELFSCNEVEHATRYIRIALDDAMEGHFNMRIFNSAHALSIISDAAGFIERKRHDNYVTMIVVISSMLIVILTLLILSLRQRRRLARSYDKIAYILAKLKEADAIKDGYLFRYMIMSVEYLKKLDDYKHNLRVIAKNDGTDALVREIRSASSSSDDYKTFYKVFDDTFLCIFPDFPSKVNELLRDDAALSLNADGSMPTALRILASIRLGIVDSMEIARFLNCALSSVYTHRCKLRASAVCKRDEFEQKLLEIS